jgi:purine-binding chemotaxis protein CheW
MIDYSSPSSEHGQFLTAYVNGHYLGIPIHTIQDVIGPQALTGIPLARDSIAGVLNLRGRIVTVIDMHNRLKEPRHTDRKKGMGIIIESCDELFSLLIDHVEDVKTIALDDIEKTPPTLNPIWERVCTGVFQFEDQIMIILDIENILDLDMQYQA